MSRLQKLLNFLRDKENRESILALTTILTVLGGGISWGVKTFYLDNIEKAPNPIISVPPTKTIDPTIIKTEGAHPVQEQNSEKNENNGVVINNSPIFTGNNANVTINQKN